MKKDKKSRLCAAGMAWLLLLGGALLLSGCDEPPELEEILADGEVPDDGGTGTGVGQGGGAGAVYKSYYVKATGNDGSTGTETAPLATVTEALEKLAEDYAAASPAWPNKGAVNEGSGEIVILGELSVLNITIDGGGGAIYPPIVLSGGSGADAGTLALTWYNAPILTVENGASVSLRGITLKGTGDNLNPVKVKSDGNLFLEDGALITHSINHYYYGGIGVVNVDGANAKFTMNGGEISGNTSVVGGGVYVVDGGLFTMTGGIISNNAASGSAVGHGGGGVHITGGTFSMTGGKISGNNGYISGGVYVINNGLFIKTGGIIYGSDADDGLKNIAGNSTIGGHAVYATNGAKYRNMTAGSGVNLYIDNTTGITNDPVDAGDTTSNWGQ